MSTGSGNGGERSGSDPSGQAGSRLIFNDDTAPAVEVRRVMEGFEVPRGRFHEVIEAALGEETLPFTGMAIGVIDAGNNRQRGFGHLYRGPQLEGGPRAAVILPGSLTTGRSLIDRTPTPDGKITRGVIGGVVSMVAGLLLADCSKPPDFSTKTASVTETPAQKEALRGVRRTVQSFIVRANSQPPYDPDNVTLEQIRTAMGSYTGRPDLAPFHTGMLIRIANKIVQNLRT